MKELSRKELPWALILAAFCLFLYLPCLGNRDLWGSVEPQYAEVARETLVEGHWIIPHYNGSVYTIKPPLYPWLIALVSMPAGDVTEFTARLPSALSALGMVLVIYSLGKELFSQRVGLLAALILATSPQFYKSACMVRIDMPLAFLATSSLAAFYIGSAKSERSYYYLSGFFAALAALIKGPLVPLMTATIIILYLYSKRKLGLLKEPGVLLGGGIFTAAIVAWLLAVYSEGGYSYLCGLYSQLYQYITKGYHSESIYFYLPEIFGLGPWAPLIPVAFLTFFKDKTEGLRFPCIWFLTMFVVFSIIATKHSRYLLPLYPAAALLAAAPLDAYLAKGSPAWPISRAIPLLLFAGIVGVEIAMLESHCLPTPALSLTLGGVGLLTTIYFALRARQFRLTFGAVLLVLIAFEVSRYQILLPGENGRRSEKALCQAVIRLMEPRAQLVVYRDFRPAYIFYTKRYIRGVNTEKELAKLFSSEDRVYCLIREELLQELKLPVAKVARLKGPGRRKTVFILISNHPDKG